MLVGSDGTEDDLGEALSGKHPKTDASDYAAIFDKGEGFVLPVKMMKKRQDRRVGAGHALKSFHSRVKHQPRDVLFGHAGQLVREDILKTHKPHQDLLVGLLGEGVSDDVELDDAAPLFQPGSLVAGSIRR